MCQIIVFAFSAAFSPTQKRAGRVNSSSCCACSAALARRIRPPSPLLISCKLFKKQMTCCINIRLVTPCAMHTIQAAAGQCPVYAQVRSSANPSSPFQRFATRARQLQVYCSSVHNSNNPLTQRATDFWCCEKKLAVHSAFVRLTSFSQPRQAK